MKAADEIRAEAWQVIREGHWVMKFLVIMVVMGALSGLVQRLWSDAVVSMGIQTWSVFLEAKLKAVSSGLDLTVPSRAVALGMTKASAFEMFFTCILQGIVSFGICSLFLQAARRDASRWFVRAFGGFRFPLGVAWLYFRYALQIALWSLLFLIPGVVAYYRYCQSWNLKIDHPDWSAGRCLAESCRMMNGGKWRRFCLDCSYWKPITLLLLGLLAASVLVFLAQLDIFPGSREVFALVMFLLALVCMWGGVVLGAYMSIGQAMFYLNLSAPTPDRLSDPQARNA